MNLIQFTIYEPSIGSADSWFIKLDPIYRKSNMPQDIWLSFQMICTKLFVQWISFTLVQKTSTIKIGIIFAFIFTNI